MPVPTPAKYSAISAGRFGRGQAIHHQGGREDEGKGAGHAADEAQHQKDRQTREHSHRPGRDRAEEQVLRSPNCGGRPASAGLDAASAPSM